MGLNVKNGIFCCLLSLVIGYSNQSFSMNKVVYGEDDRQDLYEVSDRMLYDLAHSTAAMIANYQLEDLRNDQNEIKVKGGKLSDRNICKTEKFAEQKTAANCSGFLIAPDIIVTAGHCATDSSSCSSYSWVFGFGLESENDTTEKVRKSDVYKCKEILEQTLDNSTKNDYAVIKLDRPVEGRTPLQFRKEGKIEDHDGIVVIGHPTGLPTKVAGGANVRKNTDNYYFVTNLDTFGGNSGSAVFNARTGIVEGILVRGETDYVNDREQNCKVVNVCKNDECRGEDVTRITNVKYIKNL